MSARPSSTANDRWWDLFTAVLIVLLFQILTQRLAGAGWVEHLNNIVGITIPAIIIGLLVGYSRLPGWIGWVMILFHGAVASSWLSEVVYIKNLPWLVRTGLLLERLQFSFSQISGSYQVSDPLLFYVSITLVIWLLAASAGYFHTRHGSTWLVFIPATILFVIIDRYDLTGKLRSFYFFCFAFTVILLLMRTALYQRSRQWVRTEIIVPPGVSFELTRTAGIVALVFLTTIWMLPAVSKAYDPAYRIWREITRPLDSTREKISNALAPLKSSNISNSIQFYDSFNIGRSARQESTVVFTARAFVKDPLAYRFYWRTRSYDHYENGNWKNTIDTEVDPKTTFSQPAMDAWITRDPISFQFTTQTDSMNVIVTEQSPYQISQSARIFGFPIDPNEIDVDYLKPLDPMERGTSYRVTSLKSNPTVAELQATGFIYPDWVKNNYLQLPGNFNPLIRELAQKIVSGEGNPYDRVTAITQYLRGNYQYITSLPPAPQGDDPIDVFLFEDREGFCNHFASAEVLMLRSIGIPARMVVGFAEGEFDELTGIYVVRIKDTHAWPEVYFADHGWVIFEPTSNQEPLVYAQSAQEQRPTTSGGLIDRSESFLSTPAPEPEPKAPLKNLPLKRQTFQSTQDILPLLLPVLLALVLIVLLFLLVDRIPVRTLTMASVMESGLKWTGIKPPRLLTRWSAYLKRLPMEQAFLLPDMLFGLLKLPPNPGQTIRERVELWEKILPDIRPFSNVLVREYEKELYGNGNGNIMYAHHASRMIEHKIINAFVKRHLPWGNWGKS